MIAHRYTALAVSSGIVLVEILACWLGGVLQLLRGTLQAIFGLYIVMFFALLTFATFFRCLSTGGTSVVGDALKGAALGYSASLVAIGVATLLMPDGLERIAASQRLLGPLRFMVHQLGFAFLTGGWLFGAVAFMVAPGAVVRWLDRRGANSQF